MKFLFNYLKRLLFLIIIYTTSRVYFYIINIDSFNNTRIIDFIEGFRFDISALVYINIPILLLLLTPSNFRKGDNFWKFTNILFYILNIPFIILNNIDIEYFRFTQKRSTADFFQLLQLGEDAKNIIPQYIKYYWPITLFTILQIWLLLKIRFRVKITNSINFKNILQGILIFIIGGAFFIVSARGGLQLKPIKPINAGELSGSQNSALILNTPFCILHSLEEKSLKTYNYFNTKDLKKIYSPIYSSFKNKMKKQNIVILIMESYSKEFVGFYNNGIGYTPFLDSLMEHSLVFTNAYANGLKSIEALPAITASIPALMDEPFITSVYGHHDVKSVASILNNEGYNTSFYHGGTRGTMGFYSFSKKAGFTDYFGLEEYNNNDNFDGSWGIYDGPFMNFFADGLNDKKEPFFSTFFSLSSHPPYVLPEDYIKKLNKKEQHKISSTEIGIRETILYTDYCMQDFFNKSKNQAWFQNTIFVITADHTSSENYIDKYKNKIGRYAIPLIIFSGDSSLQAINRNIVQHIDIMPSILDILNYNKPFISFGKSMFSKESWAINFLQDEYRLITDNSIIINKDESYISFSDWNTSKKNNLKHADKKLLKAIKQEYNYRISNNKLFK